MAISFNDNIRISAPKPIDAKYLNSSNIPYSDDTEVNTTILEAERYLGLTVNINNVEYWYETGVGDGDLLLKTADDIFVSGGTLSGTTLGLHRTEGLTDVTIELSGLTDGFITGDTFVSGGTYSGSTLSLQRTQGFPDVTVNIGVSGVTDGVVSGGTLNGTTLELQRSIGLSDVLVDLSALSGTTTDVYVSGGTLDGSAQLALARSEGQSDVIIDLSALSGGSGGNDEYTGSTPSTVEVGGLSSGSVLTGRTYTSIFQEMLVVYLDPAFNGAPTVTVQNYTVEVGTTLSGSRTFSWSTSNSSNVSPNTIAIYDTTDSSYLAQNLANDGSESATIKTFQLNTNGAIQEWKTEGINTNSILFSSANRKVTARYYRFYGASATSPTNSAEVRALTNSTFQTSNSNTFILATGSNLTKFVVALPPSRTISSVTDLDALNADITSEYIFTGTINVLDDGGTGTSRTYNMYEMNIGSPYSVSHDHEIQTA